MHLVERKYDEAAFAALRAAGVKPLFARLLAARGIGVENLETYLAPAFRNLVPGDGLPGIRGGLPSLAITTAMAFAPRP